MRALGVLLLVGWLGVVVAEEEKAAVFAVEPEVQKAFDEALGKLPVPLREEVGDVRVVRAADLGVGAEVALEYRLLSRAAYASFGILERQMTVYDAAVEGRPTWGQEAPSAAEMQVFLAGVADVLGVDAPEEGESLVEAWAAFVARVYSWSGDAVPAPVPSVGAPVVLDRFLADGVWHLMDGEVPMVDMLVHEFGHGLQLDLKAGMISRMAYWGTLSGCTETRYGEVADGFVGGMNTMEHAMVMIRLLLTDDPEGMARGPSAHYDVSKEARFVDRYARYDLREDYAECFRLMVADPEKLVKIAPEKFVYLNALGWNARLDGEKPGPLWYAGAEFGRLLPKGGRKELFERLLGMSGKGPALDPVAMGAVLRAHAGELAAEDLPEPYEVVGVPMDLPETLRKALGAGRLTAEIGEVVHVASPVAQRGLQDEVICNWIQSYDFGATILRLSERGTKGLKGAYAEFVEKADDAVERGQRYEAFREAARGVLTEEEMRAFDLKEAKFLTEAENKWAAARYAILAQRGEAAIKFAEVKRLLESAPPGYDRVMICATAVEVAMAVKDVGLIKRLVGEIPGETLGAWLRVRYLLRAAEMMDGAEFREAAKGEVEKCGYPMLKEELGLLVGEGEWEEAD